MANKSTIVETKTRTDWVSTEFSFKDFPFNVVLSFNYRKDDEAIKTLNLFSVTVKLTEKKYKPANESLLLHHLKLAMNVLLAEQHMVFGVTEAVIPPFIKKLMWKDGHLVDDTCHYLRTSGKPKKDLPYYGIWDANYAIRLSTEKLKESGEVSFTVGNLS